ncbi:MAG: class I SAM-dependent methyltransferase [Candidatus Aminicenantes bacterium]|nr:class I SAM-dependent methyltransferase [Candidatus Aminicenantes bacterium]MCK5004775.1 class I SAM-dependent methyltransferase [Candidatus Aminicenantes bacterium]
MPDSSSNHYDKNYFDWQAPIGEFGGWANRSKFNKYISDDKKILDYGCGGGYLLKNFKCSKKVGVEINPSAAKIARDNGVQVFESLADVPDNYVDLIISNHALEHAHHPLAELKSLYKKLEAGGKIVFVVPCETISAPYDENDINNHLYTWNPLCLGNLFKEAGFSVIESKPLMHKWRMKFKILARFGGRRLFELACRIYARVDRSTFQVRVIAEKKRL